MNNESVTLFARTNFRDKNKIFGIQRFDRRYHMYIIGKTGMGKSTLLETLILQDLRNGEGLALLDPHGDLVDKIIANFPLERAEDLLYFNVADQEHPLGFNPLEYIPSEQRSLMAGGLLKAFEKIWSDAWGARMEHILRNALHALLDYPGSTLADILRLFRDKDFRRRVADNTPNQIVKEYWLHEFEAIPQRSRMDYLTPVLNKIEAFLADPILNAILTQPKSSFDLRTIMDDGKVILVNLAKGKIGEDAASLLGALLLSKIEIAALSRADLPPAERRDFYLYLDEFQTMSTKAFVNLLSELRKYGVSLILAHQYMSQLDSEVRDAVLGNAGTMISFRVGPDDASVLSKIFAPTFQVIDFINLPKHNIYLRLSVDGVMTQPFSAKTLEPSDILDP